MRVLAGLFLVLAACQQAPAPPLPEQARAEKLDPFVVMIGAERWGVIIDRAYEGAIQAPYANNALDEDDKLRTDRAVKSGAAELIRLRNMVCAKGLLSASECELRDWPSWVLEVPTTATSWEELERRSDWLGGEMDRFTAVGCDIGRRTSNDDLFCSVE